MSLTSAYKNQGPSAIIIKTTVCSANGQIHFLILVNIQHLPPRFQGAVHKRQLNQGIS